MGGGGSVGVASLAVAGTACTAQPASSARCLQHILSLTTLSVKNLFTGCLDLFDTFEFPLSHRTGYSGLHFRLS